MTEFEIQFKEIKSFLEFEDYSLLIKRIIDLTLDTEDLHFYNETLLLLDWLDNKPADLPETKVKFIKILDDLYEFLSKKSIAIKINLITANNITKSYGTGKFSIGPVNLTLNQGEIVGLVGENGNGKTTLLRLLCCELFYSSGKLNYGFKYSDQYDLRTKLVYIPQRTNSWYGSILQNLQFTATCYGYSATENKAVVALLIARLGLRKFRNYSWQDLSSGYKMRFELARMLLRKPKVLLIDEPLANLDIIAQQTILEDFKYLAKSPFRPLGIVLSSQQLYEVEKTSDQVVFLKNGIQKNLHFTESNNQESQNNLVIEFESDWNQDDLYTILNKLNLISLKFNGGTYIATFAENYSIHDFMTILSDNKVPILYLRNISNSTRRFFVS